MSTLSYVKITAVKPGALGAVSGRNNGDCGIICNKTTREIMKNYYVQTFSQDIKSKYMHNLVITYTFSFTKMKMNEIELKEMQTLNLISMLFIVFPNFHILLAFQPAG